VVEKMRIQAPPAAVPLFNYIVGFKGSTGHDHQSVKDSVCQFFFIS
jgi:hypothetical protein